MPIAFHIESGIFKIKNIAKIKSWLKAIFKQYGITSATINYVFCDDAYLLDINQKYLSHDTFTDIITFDLKENQSQNHIKSDIYISLERIQENASIHNCSNFEELLRVMSHGILHLLGLKDKSAKEALQMRAAEEECISLYHNIHSVPRGTLK